MWSFLAPESAFYWCWNIFFNRCPSSEPMPSLPSSSEYSVIPPFKESTLLPPFSCGPSGPVGLLRGEFSPLDRTKFYVHWGFLGDFKMFDLHSSCDSALFVVMGDVISHCSECAEFDSAFKDPITGVWLSLSIFIPYRFGTRLASRGSISRSLYRLAHSVSNSGSRSTLNQVSSSRSSFTNFFPRPVSFLEVLSGHIEELPLNGENHFTSIDTGFQHSHHPESHERGTLSISAEGSQSYPVDGYSSMYDYSRE